MMMNSCWPYGASAQQLNLSSLDRPIYDSNTLAMLAQRYQPSSIMNALISSLANNQSTLADDNNNNHNHNDHENGMTHTRLTMTNIDSNHSNCNNNESNENEQTTTNENRSNNTNLKGRIWRPLDIMK